MSINNFPLSYHFIFLVQHIITYEWTLETNLQKNIMMLYEGYFYFHCPDFFYPTYWLTASSLDLSLVPYCCPLQKLRVNFTALHLTYFSTQPKLCSKAILLMRVMHTAYTSDAQSKKYFNVKQFNTHDEQCDKLITCIVSETEIR